MDLDFLQHIVDTDDDMRIIWGHRMQVDIFHTERLVPYGDVAKAAGIGPCLRCVGRALDPNSPPQGKL